MESPRERLRALLARRSLIFGAITLSNGQQANYYFDCKRVTLSPEGADLVADVFLEQIERLPKPPTAIGGLTHGADPILGAVMMRAYERGRNLETFYVRKEPKQHGTKQLIENPPPAGSRVVIVEDVITSGTSALKAVEQATAAGCEVVAVIALVDRDQGGEAAIRAQCSHYIPLFHLSDFPEIESAAARSGPAYR
jgi:orotate phosphoribosyltransferase